MAAQSFFAIDDIKQAHPPSRRGERAVFEVVKNVPAAQRTRHFILVFNHCTKLLLGATSFVHRA
jgi:hypothetical protein